MDLLKHKIIPLLMLTGVVMAVQTPARADGFYIGAGLYQSDAQIDDFDENDSTSALFVGYTFIDSVIMLSAELGRYDLGTYSSGGTEIDSTATSLAGVLYLPLGPIFELYAKTGIAATDLKVNGDSDSKNESFGGFGFGIDILDTIDFYAEYLEFNTDVDFNMIGVGIRLDF